MEAIPVEETPTAVVEFELRPGRGATRDPLSMEHRFGQRFRCGNQVRLSAGDLAGGGRLSNVSLSGAYLETALDLPLFATVEISGHGEHGKAVRLSASVVRKDAGGAGVEWCETPGRSICSIFGCTRHCEVE
jgi:hypothetical protein